MSLNVSVNTGFNVDIAVIKGKLNISVAETGFAIADKAKHKARLHQTDSTKNIR